MLPWALSIARRLLIDEDRRAARSALSFAQQLGLRAPTEPDALEWLSASDLEESVKQELAGLPPLQRAAFELVRVDGLTHAQAAEALGVSVSSVKLRAHRAYAALRRAFSSAR